jgi:hypothetical protein
MCAGATGLSHEQLLELRGVLHSAGLGKQGHSRSKEENARALLHVHQYRQQGLSYDAAIKATAAAELASPSTVRAAAKGFAATGALTPPRTPVNRSNPNHPFYSESGPSLAAEQLIHSELHDVALNNVFQSCATLRHELEEQLGVVVSKSTVHRWLHTCAVQTREAMEKVTADLCQKQIQHCHAWIDKFMQSEEGGSLQQFGTLQALQPLAAALQQCDDDASTTAPHAEEEEEEEGEGGWTH